MKQIGFIGLGKMGSNMVLNLLDKDYKPVVYNRSPEPTKKLSRKGVEPSYSYEEFVSKLPKRKVIWMMVPAKAVDEVLENLQPLLNKNDIIIDGGNSYYKDSIERYKELKKKGINFVDVGTSGGVEGARHGACMMVGGDKPAFKKTENLYKSMCVKNGYGYIGESGAGHFVKAVHNGIEYGMMAAISEGMNAIKKESKKFKTDLKEVAKVYSNGSIIESRLIKWLKDGMNRNYYKKISGKVPKGETEDEMDALTKEGKMKMLEEAIKIRENSRKKPSFMGKLISVMRNEFGGHKFNRK